MTLSTVQVQTSSKFKLNGHQKRKHPTPGTNQRGSGQQYLLINHLLADYPTFLKQHRPNSKWTIERIVNLSVIHYLIGFLLGRPPKLRTYIKDNRFIIG